MIIKNAWNDFKDIKFPVKIKDIQTNEKKNEKTFVFLVMKTSKNTQSVCHKILSRDADLLLIVEEGKKRYVCIKDLNTFMYDHRLYRRRCR